MGLPIRIALVALVACTAAPAQGPRAATFTGARSAVDGAAQYDGGDATSGVMGLDIPTAYFFRGLRIEDRGVIAQPYLELTQGLHAGDGDLRSVDLVLGTWNSLHEGPSGTGGGASLWYEGDFYLTLACGLGASWSASATYSWYASPNGSFAVAEEVVCQLGCDDAPLWGGSFGGLQPSLTLGFETKGQADGGAERGTYAQLAIEPSVPLGRTSDLDWTLALPCAVGLSLGDYYEDPTTGGDDALGFVDLGAAASTPLPTPARLGPWTMTLSVHVLLLGDTAEQLNRDDDVEIVATLGVSTAF
jgi:hypothetical protein